jgi:hypothetical protein
MLKYAAIGLLGLLVLVALVVFITVMAGFAADHA